MSGALIFTVDDGQYPPDPIHFFGADATNAQGRAQQCAEVIGHNEVIEHGVVGGKVVQARWKRTADGWVTTSERPWADR